MSMVHKPPRRADLQPLKSGMFLIYMQAIRFLTDHLNNDVYYGSAYEGHNYMRAKNQICLLQRLMEKEEVLNKMVSDWQRVLISNS